MSDVNNCVFSGRLTRDAEQKILPTGTRLVSFDLANNTGFGDNEKVLYVTVNLWGKLGENIFQYLLKGKAVAVCGKLEMQRWISKHDDTEKTKLVLNCNEITFLASARTNGMYINKTSVTDVDASPITGSEDVPF